MPAARWSSPPMAGKSARGRIARTISKLPEMTDTLDIGFDADTSVTDDYADGGHFTGRILKVDIAVGKQGVAGEAR